MTPDLQEDIQGKVGSLWGYSLGMTPAAARALGPARPSPLTPASLGLARSGPA